MDVVWSDAPAEPKPLTTPHNHSGYFSLKRHSGECQHGQTILDHQRGLIPGFVWLRLDIGSGFKPGSGDTRQQQCPLPG
jgi:hypothetical protein